MDGEHLDGCQHRVAQVCFSNRSPESNQGTRQVLVTRATNKPTVQSLTFEGIDWVIVGGESGPGARPMDPSWVRGDSGYLPRLEGPVFL